MWSSDFRFKEYLQTLGPRLADPASRRGRFYSTWYIAVFGLEYVILSLLNNETTEISAYHL